jgi:hypothetical protein
VQEYRVTRFIFGLTLALTAIAAPARAADLATLDCIDAKLVPATRDQLAADVRHNLQQTGERKGYTPLVTAAVKEAAAACATENGWSPAAARLASLYTLAKNSLPAVQRVASERGLDPAELEALFLALPAEQRNKPLTPELYRQLADAAIPEGDLRTQANGELLHTFFEFESILQYASLDFASA